MDYVISFGHSAKRKRQTASKEVTIDVLINVQLFSEPGHVVYCVGKLTEEKFCVCIFEFSVGV
jgi:hypothetical protein